MGNGGVPIYANGKLVGKVYDGVFYKRIKGSIHILQKFNAIALDNLSLKHAQEAGANTIEVHDTETNIKYSTSMYKVLADGFAINFGYGDQTALPISSWTVIDDRQLKLGV